MAILNVASVTANAVNNGEKAQVEHVSTTVRTDVLDTDIVVSKTPARNWVVAKDKIKITTYIENNTSSDISDITITDTLSAGASFVEGSLYIGSEAHPEYDPIAGFTPSVTIGALGGEFYMSYDVQIDQYIEAGTITTTSKVEGTVASSPFQVTSSALNLSVLNNEISVAKTASVAFVTSKSQIVYTIVVTNEGDLANTDLVFKDQIPAGTTFEPQSVKVDGVVQTAYNPQDGFALKDLNPTDSTTVEFAVNVD